MYKFIFRHFMKFFLIIIFAAMGLFGCASGGIKNSAGKPITDVLSALESGEARLTCDVACSGEWGSTRAKAKRLHDYGLWKDLAFETARVGFRVDQAYYYLGRAAEGLEYYKAADTYYRLALLNPYKCDGFINNCDGFVFPRDINTRQSIVSQKIAQIEKGETEKKAEEDKKIAAEKAMAEAERAAQELAEAKRVAAELAEAERAAAELAAAEDAAAKKEAKKAAAEGVLNIIGLFPGISTQQQVEFAKDSYGYIIGGYELLCIPEFDNKKLYSFTCMTGEKNLSRDRVSGNDELVSNIEVYNTLLNGFSKKFGRPKISENQVRTNLGVKYVSELAVWKDHVGNELSLLSIGTTTDSGALILKSAKQIQSEKIAEEKANKARKF